LTKAIAAHPDLAPSEALEEADIVVLTAEHSADVARPGAAIVILGDGGVDGLGAAGLRSLTRSPQRARWRDRRG
jgi:hypothetical protein